MRIKGSEESSVVGFGVHKGWMKINIDAAVFLNGSIGVGAIIRDSHAKFVGAR